MLSSILDGNSYQFQIYTFPPLLVGLSIVLLGLVTLVRERGGRVSWLFLFMASAVGFWLMAIALAYAATDAAIALWWIKAEHVGVHLIPGSLFHFATTVTGTYRENRRLVLLGWLFSALLALLTVSSDLLVADVYHYWFGYYPRYSWSSLVFLAFFGVTLWLSIRQFWLAWRHGTPGTISQRRARAFFVAFAIGYLGVVDYLPAFGIEFYPLGFLPILAFLLLSAFTISRYHLIDITPAFAAREIVHTMSEALLVLDQEGLVRVANPAVGLLFERPAVQLIGQLFSALFEEASVPDLAPLDDQGNAAQRQEYVYHRPSGETRYLSISASALRNSRRDIVATVCLIRDVTERKKAENRVRREAARSEALRRVAARLNAQLELDSVLEAVCEETARAFSVPLAGVTLYDAHNNTFHLAAAHGLPKKYQKLERSDPRKIFSPRTETYGTITVTPDVREAPMVANSTGWNELNIRTYASVSLLREGELVGYLEVGTIGEVRHFSQDELELVQGLADQAAQAITNARLYAEAQRRLSQVQALRAIDRAITSSPGLRSTLDVLLEQVVTHLNIDAAAVLLYNHDHRLLDVAAGRGFYSEVSGNRLQLEHCFAGRAVLEQTTISIPNMNDGQPEEWRKGLVEEEGFVTYFAVPLVAKKQVKAVLELFHRTPFSPSLEWLNFMETLAGQAALAIDNASLFAETRRQSAHLATLNNIITASTAASGLSELQEIALNSVLKALDLKQGAIWVLGQHAVAGFDPAHSSGDNPLVRLAQQARLPLVVTDWRNEERAQAAQQLESWGVRASVTGPVVAEGRWIGGLSLASPSARFWSREEIALVEAVGQQLGSAAERLQLLAQREMHARQVQQIADTVPEGLLLLDDEHHVVRANPVAREYLALLAEAPTADRPLRCLGDRPVVELLASGGRGEPALEITVEEPEQRIFEVVARPMQDGVQGQAWLLVLRDVTVERRMKERVQQQQRLAAVGQLAAGIAHDFNNIMLVISLYAQMIERTTELPPKASERLQTIRQQAIHATNLIEQILDFSRRSVLERRPLEVLPFVEEFVQLLQRTLPENIDIVFASDCDEYVVNADATRLQQVLMNLAVNARDAMPHGGKLHITLDALEVRETGWRPAPEINAGHWLALAVADTGQGIAAHNLPHLFEPFFTTKDPGQGTGLGLAQVYGIVRQHDGYLNVESELGKGTTFTVYLPAMSLPQKLEVPGARDRGQASGGETILVAEDDVVAREAIQNILESEGYRVLLAADGKEALDVYAAHRDEIALVLSDMVMPQMGSVELFQTLQEEDPALKMVVITGYPLEDDGRSLLEQGILSWMSKPFSMEQLVTLVRDALDGA